MADISWKRLPAPMALPLCLCLALGLAADGRAAPADPPAAQAGRPDPWLGVGADAVAVGELRAAVEVLARDGLARGLSPEQVTAGIREAIAVASAGVGGMDGLDALERALELEAGRALAELGGDGAVAPGLRERLVLRVGPLELGLREARTILGPREGRDRAEVVRGLAAAAQAQGLVLTDEALLELVPVLARAVDTDSHPLANPLMAPLRQLLAAGAQQ